MSLTDKINIVNGDKPEMELMVMLREDERTYIAKAILDIPQHIRKKEKSLMAFGIIRKLGYPDVSKKEDLKNKGEKKNNEGV